jgi:hypothetical protein
VELFGGPGVQSFKTAALLVIASVSS